MTSELLWSDVSTLIEGLSEAHLATSGAGGDPHVSVVMAGLDGDRLWFLTRAGSAKAANILANPAVALMWRGNGAETYLWGSSAIVDDLSARERLWAGGVLPYDPTAFFGPPDDPGVVAVRVTPRRVVAMVGGSGGPRRRRWLA